MGYPKLIYPRAPSVSAMDDVAVSLDAIESDLEDALSALRTARSYLHTLDLCFVPSKLSSALEAAREAAKDLETMLPDVEPWTHCFDDDH